MKTIFRIARTELAILFFSPLAWLVMAVFAFQSALSLLDGLREAVAAVKMHIRLGAVTGRLYGEGGFFGNVRGNLYFYVPLLTMGLMSREISSGSIKLLQSSPVTTLQVIAGKFLGSILFGGMLIVVMLIFVLTGCGIIEHADWCTMLSGLGGIYLLIMAYFAIGLLMSCFTGYQVVSAFTTFAVLAALAYMHSLWQDVPAVQEITYMLSISGRTGNFIGGLVSSKDVIYFLLVTGYALGLAVYYLRTRQYGTPWWKRLGGYSLITGIMLLTGWVSSRPLLTAYVDLTPGKWRTVSPATQAILKGIRTPLTITTYVNLFEGNAYRGLPGEKNNIANFFEPYQRFLRREIRYEFVYYYDSCERMEDRRSGQRGLSDSAIAAKIAQSDGIDPGVVLPPAAIRQRLNVTMEQGRFGWQLEANGRKARLRIFKDLLVIPTEGEIAAALKELVTGPARIAVATGDGERSVVRGGADDYRKMTTLVTNRGALINQGFDFIEFSIDSTAIPAGSVALMIADPRQPLSGISMQRVSDYLASGGNLLVAGESGRQGLLNPLLQPLGVQLATGKLLQGSDEYAPDFILTKPDTEVVAALPAMSDVVRQSEMISAPTATAVISTGAVTTYHQLSLAVTGPSDWLRPTTVINMDSGFVHFDPAKGDVRGAYVVAMGLARNTGTKEQRIAVLGDADGLGTAELTRTNFPTGNDDWGTAIFGWLSGDTYPVTIRYTPSKDNHLRITRKDMPVLRTVFEWAVPLLLLLAGAWLLVWRRRR